MKRALVFALAAFGTAAFAACSSSSTNLGDNHPSDAGTDAPNDAISEPVVDVQSEPVDAQSEPSVDASDAACTQVVLSDQFSTGSIAGWTPHTVNGLIEVTGTLPNGLQPLSPPSALYAHVSLPDAGIISSGASIERQIVVPEGSSFDVRYALVVPASSVYAVVGCSVRFGSEDKSPTMLLIANGAALQTSGDPQDGGAGEYTTLTAQPKSSWITIDTAVTIIAGAATATYRATDANNALLGVTKTQPIPTGSPIYLVCGIQVADKGGTQTTGPDTVQVVIDDLVVTACP